MPPHEIYRTWKKYQWTVGIGVMLVLLNLGLFSWAPSALTELLVPLEFDDEAIGRGQLWRLVTGNLVHFSPNHLYLDVSVFLVLGLLYEPYFRGRFPWLLLTMCIAIGLAAFNFMDEHTRMRGLSGVDSGLFAAALYVEFGLVRNEPVRWWWVGPAALIFVVKTVYETVTGASLLGTQVLLGPAKLATTAHLAGILSALFFCVTMCSSVAGFLRKPVR